MASMKSGALNSEKLTVQTSKAVLLFAIVGSIVKCVGQRWSRMCLTLPWKLVALMKKEVCSADGLHASLSHVF